MSTMLAALYEQGAGLRVQEVPTPRIGAGELLLAIESASICATDLRIIKGAHRKYGPGTIRIPGHELTGRVAAVGPRVGSIGVGQRVFVAPNIGCGECAVCGRGKHNLCANYEAFGITMDGAFAQYMRVTENAITQGNLIPIGEEIDAAEIALAEPLACVLHGQEEVETGPGTLVVVIGAGPIGLMHMLLAKARGVKRVIASDLSAQRLEVAAGLGADAVSEPGQPLARIAMDLSSGAGADVVIVAAPSIEAQQQAIELCAPGGRINFFAGLPKDNSRITIDSNRIHYGEIWITGSTGCSTADCRKAVELVLTRKLDLSPLISARFPLEHAVDALEAAQSPANLKVVLEMRCHANHTIQL